MGRKIKHVITDEEYLAVKAAAKANQNKRIEKRLQVILMRYEGCGGKEIAQRTGFHATAVNLLCAKFKRQGLETYKKLQYRGNNRLLSEAEEKAILDSFLERANRGEMVTVREIKAAFDERLGKDSGKVYIYNLLARHKWRKVMPRPRHPKKADDEAIKASKKLTLSTKS